MSRQSYKDNLILLFLKDYQSDKFLPYDRHLKALIKPIVKPVWNLFHKRMKTSGIHQSFGLLKKSLVQAGYDVRVNDYRTARKHPDHPVGLIGWPVLLENWKLPNPALLGPSLYDHPKLGPDKLMEDPRFRKYVVLADWMREMVTPYYGDEVCVSWFAGIDTEKWPSFKDHKKTTDILIYNKIRWHHDQVYEEIIAPAKAYFDENGISYSEVKYKEYDHETYLDKLKTSQAMMFVCEHETQGLAYQEAMACDLPILAWDNEDWADHRRPRLEPEPIRASSVPFFSTACGERFKGNKDFPEKFELFWKQLSGYTPRQYVLENLSMKQSAEIYARHYFSIKEKH